MTDRCVVNKAYITRLEKFRAAALPQVTKNWQQIDDNVKQRLSTIYDLFCGKHLVLNLQEYAGSALYELENIEAGEGKNCFGVGERRVQRYLLSAFSATFLDQNVMNNPAWSKNSNPY